MANGTIPSSTITPMAPAPQQGSIAPVPAPQAIPQAAASQAAASQRGKQSPWPMVIAIAAASEGNYGPLFRLTEQRRQTKLFSEIQPLLGNRAELLEKGDFKGVTEAENEIISTIGPRSPEMLNMLTQLQAQTIKKRRDQAYGDNWVKMLEPAMKNTAVQSTMPQSTKDYYAFLKGAISSGRAPSRELLQDYLRVNQVHWQNITGAYRGVDQLTGRTTTTPNRQVLQASQVQDPIVAGHIANATNLSMPEFVNIANAVGPNGQPTPQAVAANSLLSQANTVKQQYEFAKSNSLEATLVAQLINQGVSQQDLATRNFKSGVMSTAIQEDINRKKEVIEAGELAPLSAPPQFNNLMAIDVATGRPVTTRTLREAFADPNVMVLDPKSGGQARVLYEARDKMRLAIPIIQNLANIDEPLSRVAQFATESINRRLNIDPKMTGRFATQIILRDVIEQYANATGQDATRFKQLGDSISGPGATVQTAMEVMRTLASNMEASLTKLMSDADMTNKIEFLSELDKPETAPPQPRSIPTQGSTGPALPQRTTPGGYKVTPRPGRR